MLWRRCYFSGISPECPLFSRDSLLRLVGMQRSPSPAWALGIVQFIALRHPLPGLMEFHLHTHGLIFSNISRRPHEDFWRFCYTRRFLLRCTLPCKFQLSSGSLLHQIVFPLPTPQSGKCLQAHFLYFPSLKIQNLALPIVQRLETFVSYIFSSLLLKIK